MSEGLPPSSGSRRGVRLLLALAVLAVGLAAVGAALGSHAAFQRVWLPLASRSLGGLWLAESGRVSLLGSVEVNRLQVESGGLVASVEAAALRLLPWASLRAWAPVVESLEVEGADLRFETTATQEGGGAQDPGESDGLSLDGPWPAIASARFSQVRIDFVSPESTLGLGPLEATIEGWEPGERGRIQFDLPLRRTGAGAAELEMRATGHLELAEEDASYSLELDVDVAGSQARGHEALGLALRGRGTGPEETGRISLAEGELTVVEAAERRLRIGAQGELRPALDLDLEVRAERLGHTGRWIPNPRWAGLAEGAQLDGRVHLAGDWEEPVLETQLRLAGLSIPGREGGLEEHAFDLDGELRWRTGAREMMLDRLQLSAQVEGAAEGVLDVTGRVHASGDAELDLRPRDWDLLPWLRVAGLTPGSAVEGLPLDGELRWKSEDENRELGGELRLRLAGGGAEEPRLVLHPAATGHAEGSELTVAAVLEDGSDEPGAFRVEASLPGDASEPVEVNLDLTRLDLTPWVGLWEETPSEGTPEPEAPSGPEPGEPVEGAEPSRPFEGQLEIGVVRIRDVVLRGGRGRAQLGENDRIELRDLQVGDGRVDLSAWRERRGGGTELGWDVAIEQLDLGAIAANLGANEDQVLEGLFELESSARGNAGPGESELAAPDGSLRFSLRDGQAGGTRFFDALTESSGVADFGLISFDEMTGDYDIEGGRVVVDEFRLDGDVVHLVGTGEVGLEGLDMRVNPRLGPDLASNLGEGLVPGLVGTANELLALPLVARIHGSWSDYEVIVLPATPATLNTLYSGLTGLLTPATPRP